MISRLRKVFVLLFTILIMLAGAFGWGSSIPSASAYQGSPASSNHLLVNVSKHPHCPPPPYECF